LALRRYDKAAAKEKESMWTRLARVGPIMLDRRELKELRAAWLHKHKDHKDKAVRKNPLWAGSPFAHMALRVLGHGESVLEGDALQELLTAYANGVKSFPKYCEFLNKRGAKEKWVASTRNDDFMAFNFVFGQFIAESQQYAGEDGHHAPGFKDAFVAYGMAKYPNATRKSLLDMNGAAKDKEAGVPEEKEESVAVEQAGSEAAARVTTPASLANADDAATAAAAVLRKRAALAAVRINVAEQEAAALKRRLEAREASEREARAAERQKAAEEQAVREAAHAQQLEAEKAKNRAAARLLEERAAADRATAKRAEADRMAAEKRAAQLQSKLEAAAAAKLAEEEARATAANAAADKGRADPAAAKIKRLEAELRRASQALVDRDAASKAEREKALAEADEQRRELEDELNELRRASETSDDPLDDLAARVYEAFGSEKPSRSELKLLVSELKELKVEAFRGVALNAKTEVWEEALRTWYEARGSVRARSDAPSPAELRAEYADDAEVFVTLAGEVLVVEGIKDDVEVSGQPDTQITFADVNRRSVAIKSSERNLAREAYLLRELQSCPFVVRLEYEGFYLEKRVVALEWAEGNVLEAIGEYEDNLCGSSLVFGPVFALIEAMVHLHHMGIAFLDIKPANFLWFQTGGSLVIALFAELAAARLARAPEDGPGVAETTARLMRDLEPAPLAAALLADRFSCPLGAAA